MSEAYGVDDRSALARQNPIPIAYAYPIDPPTADVYAHPVNPPTANNDSGLHSPYGQLTALPRAYAYPINLDHSIKDGDCGSHSDPYVGYASAESNLVEVTVFAARGLVAASGKVPFFRQESSDPYVAFHDSKGMQVCGWRTRVVKNNLNPEWNETMVFRFDCRLSQFKAVVMHNETTPCFLGKLVIGLPMFYGLDLDSKGWRMMEDWYPLSIGSSDRWDWLRTAPRFGEIHMRLRVRFAMPLAIPMCPIPLRAAQVEVGLGWDFVKGTDPFDIDASIVGFDAEWNVLDTISYKKLQGFDGSVCHCGDSPLHEFDDDTITLNISRLPESVECFCIIVNSFTGQSFSKIRSARLRITSNTQPIAFLGLHKAKAEQNVWKPVNGNEFSMMDCAGFFLGMIFRIVRDWAYVSINLPTTGRSADESLPVVVHYAEQNLPQARALVVADSLHDGFSNHEPTVVVECTFAEEIPADTRAMPVAIATSLPETTFTAGSVVEYFCSSQKAWIPAVVMTEHPNNTYDLDIMPNVLSNRIRWPQRVISDEIHRVGEEELCVLTDGEEATHSPWTFVSQFSASEEPTHGADDFPLPPSRFHDQGMSSQGNTLVSAHGAPSRTATNTLLCGPANAWDVEEVVKYMECLGLSHRADKFREDAIDGEMLCSLSEEDLISEVGLSKLQARKVITRLPTTSPIQFKHSPREHPSQVSDLCPDSDT